MKKHVLLLLLTLWSALGFSQKIQNIRIKATGQIRAAKFNPAEYPLDEQGNLTEAAWTKLKAAIAAGQVQLIDPPNASNVAPVVVNPFPDQVVWASGDQTLTVPANTFSDSDVLTWSAAQTSGQPLPNGVSFNATTRALVVSGTFANGSVAIRLRATDPGGLSATDDFLLTVNRANSPPPSGTFAYQRGYILGNSFTSHGAYTAINWFQNNGMAASGPDKDFPARIKAHLRANGSPTFDLRASGYGSILEQQYANPGSINYGGITSEVQEKFGTEKVDLVIVRVGENFPSGTNQTAFNQTFDNAMAAIPKTDQAKVVVSDGVWLGHDEGHTMLQNWAIARGYGFASEASIRETLVGGNPYSPYYATQYENAGVRRHYNDDGHQQIASLILAKIPTTTGGGNTAGGTPNNSGLVPEGYGNVYASNNSYVALPDNNPVGSNERNGQYNRVFLSNGQLRLGWNLKLGGAMDYVSVNGSKNVLNSPVYVNSSGNIDAGRQHLWCWYGYPNGGEEGHFTEEGQSTGRWGGTGDNKPGGSIGWNPVEAGDEGLYPTYGVRRAFHLGADVVYHKSSGKQWHMTNVEGKQDQELWIKFDPTDAKAFREHCKLTMRRTDSHTSHFPTARSQEAPVHMHVIDFKTIHYCTGQPYSNQWTSVTRPHTGGPEEFFASEPFFCFSTPSGLWGAMYAPISGRFATNTDNSENWSTSEDYQFPVFYTASHPYMSLDHQGTYHFDVAFKYGTEAEVKAWCYAQPRWKGTFNYVFNQQSRYAWHYHHAQDQLEANITDGLRVRAITNDGFHDGTDMKLKSPEVWTNGRVVKHVYIKGAFSGGHGNMTLSWFRIVPGSFGQRTEHSKNFTVQNNGQVQVIDVDLTGDPNWDGQDILGFEIKFQYPYPSAGQIGGVLWDIKQVSSSPIN